MSWLAPLVLRLLHLIYSVVISLFALKDQRRPPPRPLSATRSRTPKHLAIVLHSEQDSASDATESAFVASVHNAIGWCREAGIERLSVYDSKGLIARRSEEFREAMLLEQDAHSDSTDSDLEYPLTPPLSDYSDSRPISPEYNVLVGDLKVVSMELAGGSKRRTKSVKRKGVMTKLRPSRPPSTGTCTKALTIHILSRDSSKPAIASVARSIARQQTQNFEKQDEQKFDLSIETLDAILEGPRGLSSPDLMIVHQVSCSRFNRPPLELHGFPPWQTRLTEIQ
jgi:dehydrodolichyl diphosphate syntase complex subunit NUS1